MGEGASLCVSDQRAQRLSCRPPESGQPICGNGLVEAGEQCDCGYSDQCKDQCCYDANQADNLKCKLKPGKVCRYGGWWSVWVCARVCARLCVSSYVSA